jgi:hypothetical protein
LDAYFSLALAQETFNLSFPTFDSEKSVVIDGARNLIEEYTQKQGQNKINFD